MRQLSPEWTRAGSWWKAAACPDSSTVALMVVLKVLCAEIQFLCHTNLIKLSALCAKCSVLYADKFCSVNNPDFFIFLYSTVSSLYIFSSSISLVIYSFVESSYHRIRWILVCWIYLSVLKHSIPLFSFKNVYLFLYILCLSPGLLLFDCFVLGFLLMHAWSFLSLWNGFTLVLWGIAQGFICHWLHF